MINIYKNPPLFLLFELFAMDPMVSILSIASFIFFNAKLSSLSISARVSYMPGNSFFFRQMLHMSHERALYHGSLVTIFLKSHRPSDVSIRFFILTNISSYKYRKQIEVDIGYWTENTLYNILSYIKAI